MFSHPSSPHHLPEGRSAAMGLREEGLVALGFTMAQG